MKTSDFNYNLPENLIAQYPIEDREKSKLLIMDKDSGNLKHDTFTSIIDYLNEGDCLIFNDTKVIPARLYGYKKETKGKCEILLINETDKDIWKVLSKPAKKIKVGQEIIFKEGLLSGEVIEDLTDGMKKIKFKYEGEFLDILDILGETPLPPYIKTKLENDERYQTVYSKNAGSVAAPTAGLHFTKTLIEKIKKKNINIAYITLHVGIGTFKPVDVEDINSHKMHEEFYTITDENIEKIMQAKKSNSKIISVGTTSCRALESAFDDNGNLKNKEGWTDIFIYPGYEFKIINSLITNFHLPKSTLLMLVSALSSKENIMKAYEEAIKNEYRFFSFGDAMFID